MKVLQLTHHTTPCIGGIEKFVFNLCLQLKKLKIDSQILCLDRCPNSKKILEKNEIFNGIKIQRIPFFDLKYYKIAPAVLKAVKDFDIIHVHNIGFFSDFLALTKVLHKKKLVLNTHGGFFHTKKMSFFKKIYFHTINRIAMHFFDVIIADSKNDEKIFSSVLGKKLMLIGNGVELSPFLKMNKKREKNKFLYIGRLSKNKGLKNLIQTFSLVAKKNQKASLLIIGRDFDGIERDLNKLILKLGAQKNIFILGGVTDEKLRKEISTTKFAVSASEYEGFGIAVIEQMAAGQIPILSNIPNFNWFTDYGKSGAILDFYDNKKASEKILEIMNKPERKLADLAIKARNNSKKFGWEIAAKKYEKIYQNVMERN